MEGGRGQGIGPMIVGAQHERRALVGDPRAVQLLGAGAEDVAERVEHPAEPALAVLVALLVLRCQRRRSGEDERECCKSGQFAHGSSSIAAGGGKHDAAGIRKRARGGPCRSASPPPPPRTPAPAAPRPTRRPPWPSRTESPPA